MRSINFSALYVIVSMKNRRSKHIDHLNTMLSEQFARKAVAIAGRGIAAENSAGNMVPLAEFERTLSTEHKLLGSVSPGHIRAGFLFRTGFVYASIPALDRRTRARQTSQHLRASMDERSSSDQGQCLDGGACLSVPAAAMAEQAGANK